MSAITGQTFTNQKHALSMLEESFAAQKKDHEYNLKADGKGISLSQFYGGKVAIAKPTQIVATIVGPRRMPGGRQSNGTMQSAMGNLGDHERAVIGRDARKSYEGGHLISDKILGDDSYVEHNFVPMHTDLNSPDYRNIETKAERGLVERKTQKVRTDIPITMTVNVTYADDPFTVQLADLHANNIVPSTFAKTDTGATSITFPRRVPAAVTAKLEHTSSDDVVFQESTVGTASDARLAGTNADVDALGLLDQASQEPIWGSSSVHDQSGTSYTGGEDMEECTFHQPVPQPVAVQPKYTGGTSAPIVRAIPTVTPASVFAHTIRLTELKDKTSPSFTELETAMGKTFATQVAAAVKRRKRLCKSRGATFDLAQVGLELSTSFKSTNAKRAQKLMKDPKVQL